MGNCSTGNMDTEIAFARAFWDDIGNVRAGIDDENIGLGVNLGKERCLFLRQIIYQLPLL